jgi:hypothetical protein
LKKEGDNEIKRLLFRENINININNKKKGTRGWEEKEFVLNWIELHGPISITLLCRLRFSFLIWMKGTKSNYY